MPETRQRSAHRAVTNRLRHALGLRQRFVVAGVRYREASSEPLRHALSRKGPGFKEYDVTFPDGAAMRIRCTARRVYADLAPSRLEAVCARAQSVLRPGMRVLLLGGGTGDAGALIAYRVAPSGAVVSLDQDRESIEYAQRRYRLPNASFEVGGIDGVAGETDGAFNAVVAVDPLGPQSDTGAVLTELWRVVAPGGRLMLAAAPGARAEEAVGRLGTLCGTDPEVLTDGREGWMIALAARPVEP